MKLYRLGKPTPIDKRIFGLSDALVVAGVPHKIDVVPDEGQGRAHYRVEGVVGLPSLVDLAHALEVAGFDAVYDEEGWYFFLADPSSASTQPTAQRSAPASTSADRPSGVPE